MATVWRRLGDANFGLANRLSDAFAALEWREPGAFVDVRRSSELLVACDFAGSHCDARYEAFAFLIGAIGHSGAWMEARASVREEFLRDRHEMSYKGLNHGQRQRAPSPILFVAANLFPGNLIVVMVDRAIARLFDDPGAGVLLPELIVAVRDWNAKSFRRLLLVGTLGAVLVSGLMDTSQDVLWVTDEDEIASNPKSTTAPARVPSLPVDIRSKPKRRAHVRYYRG